MSTVTLYSFLFFSFFFLFFWVWEVSAVLCENRSVLYHSVCVDYPSFRWIWQRPSDPKDLKTVIIVEIEEGEVSDLRWVNSNLSEGQGWVNNWVLEAAASWPDSMLSWTSLCTAALNQLQRMLLSVLPNGEGAQEKHGCCGGLFWRWIVGDGEREVAGNNWIIVNTGAGCHRMKTVKHNSEFMTWIFQYCIPVNILGTLGHLNISFW